MSEDRLAEIQEAWGGMPGGPISEDMQWLIAEVKRLRANLADCELRLTIAEAPRWLIER